MTDFRDSDWLVRVERLIPDLGLNPGDLLAASTTAESPRAVIVAEDGEHHIRRAPCDGKVIAGIVGIVPPGGAS